MPLSTLNRTITKNLSVQQAGKNSFLPNPFLFARLLGLRPPQKKLLDRRIFRWTDSFPCPTTRVPVRSFTEGGRKNLENSTKYLTRYFQCCSFSLGVSMYSLIRGGGDIRFLVGKIFPEKGRKDLQWIS